MEWRFFVVRKYCFERVSCFSLVQSDSHRTCSRQSIGYKGVSDDDDDDDNVDDSLSKSKEMCVCVLDLPLLTVFDSASTKSIFDILEERCAHMGFVASSSFIMMLSSCLISKLLLLLPLLPSLRLRSSSKELPIELDTLRFKPELSLSSSFEHSWGGEKKMKKTKNENRFTTSNDANDG